MTIEHHDFKLPITTEANLKTFIDLAFGIQIPDKQICPNHATPWQAFADAYFVRSPVAVWKASRAFGGKSFLLALLGLTEAITLKTDVNILGGSGEQSRRVHGYMEDFWRHESAPRQLLASDPLKRETRLAWGNVIQALLASQTSVRGPHVSRLRLDEIDELDIKILDAALGQTMSMDGVPAQTVLSSTHQYAAGTMTEILQRATEKGWSVFEWCVSGNCGIMGIDRIIPMREIQKGERIYAYDNGKIIETTVSDAWCSGIRQTIIITTEQGSIECTPEHRILTKQGWRQAGSIQCGEMVCTVREEQSNARRYAMQDLSLRQPVPGLQQADFLEWDTVQVLYRQAQQQLARAGANREDHLPNVQGAQTTTLQNMFILLQKEDDKEKHVTGRLFSTSKGANSKERKQSQTPKQCRKERGRTFSQARVKLSIATKIRTLYSRLCIARLFASCRSQWALLAQQFRTNGARSQEASSNRGQRDAPASSVGRRIPSLDFAVVRSIRKGLSIPVYDLTVAEGNSFIANGIVVHNCWKETVQPHGWLPTSEIERKKNEVTAVMWNVEFDLQEPSPESRAILPEKVEAMFKAELGTFEGRNGEYIEIEPPQEGARYSTGADWAKKVDWTIIITFRKDVNPMRLVAFERMGRKPWPLMVGKFDERMKRYGGDGAHDGTGLGDVVDGYMMSDATSVIMAGRARSDLLSNYISGIERGEIESPVIKFMQGEHRYASVDDVYGSGKSAHLPDTIAAGALAYGGGSTWSFG